MYKDMQSLDVYLVFSDWDTDQPLFSVVDGWSVVNGTWKYNALTKEFTSTVH
jgi:phosphoserine phosphatase